MLEYLRQLSREQLVRVASSFTGNPKMALQRTVLEGGGEREVMRCKEEVLSQHLSKSLETWVGWNKAGQRVSDAYSTREFTTTTV